MKTKTFNKQKEILVLSPEIQLIDVYKILYSPFRAEDWENYLSDETKLFLYLNQYLKHSCIFQKKFQFRLS